MRVWAIVLNPESQIEEKFEILDRSFIPEKNAIIVLKTGDKIVKASVWKVENVLERSGINADFILNVFIKILPEDEQFVN